MRIPLVLGTAMAAFAAMVPMASAAPHAAPAQVPRQQVTTHWAPYDQNTVIVKYRQGTTSRANRAMEQRAGAARWMRGLRTGADLLWTDQNPAQVAARIAQSPNVEYAEPNYIVRIAAPTPQIPNDPGIPLQYGLHNTGQQGGTVDADIDGPEGFATLSAANVAGAPVRVGIVDTGVDREHRDLARNIAACARATGRNGQVVEGECDDGNGHGTHVAGILGARADDGRGIAGVASNARLIICKGLGDDGSGNIAAIADCIVWAAEQGATVINMSLGGPGDSATLRQAVRTAFQQGRGALLVASAGNAGNSVLNFPAAYEEVVSVAATDRRDRRAAFSTFNADVEVAAPGVDIVSSLPGNRYGLLSGTSMSAPFASGVAAAIRARFPDLTAEAARNRLTRTVNDLGARGRDQNFGFGRVNLCNAVASSAAERCD
jgi:thermitase